MKTKTMSISVSIMLCFFLLGCTSRVNTATYNLSRTNDDGSAFVEVSTLPDTIGGLSSGLGGINVGYLASEDQLYRAYYRFNITNWQGNDLKFHLKSNLKTGDPGALAVYVIDDFGSLSGIENADVSFYWGLAGTGTLAEEISPGEEWFEVTLPKNIIESKKTESGFVAIMVKLSNEDRMTNGVYNLLSYEQAGYVGVEKPYLTENY